MISFMISIAGTDIIVTQEDAKALYDELDVLFGNKLPTLNYPSGIRGNSFIQPTFVQQEKEYPNQVTC
jgi:hypothetical protein